MFLHVPPFCRNSTVNLSPQCSLRSFIAAAILDLQLPVSRHGVSVVFVEMLDKSSGCNCNVCKLRSWHFRTEPPRPSWNSGFPPTGGPKQSAAPLNLKVAPHFANYAPPFNPLLFGGWGAPYYWEWRLKLPPIERPPTILQYFTTRS